MKVLWFTNTCSLYDQNLHSYNGGGWISSLELLLSTEAVIELAIAFFHPSGEKKTRPASVCYYPIKRAANKKRPVRQLFDNWSGNLTDDIYYPQIYSVIDDFKPDIIHVFGTEGPFAKVQEYTKTPVVIHLQGLINPCLDAYFPPGCSSIDFITNTDFLLNNIFGNSPLFAFNRFKKQARREMNILQNARYVMGRTDWDKQIAKLYNPAVEYFHINEMLRPPFYRELPVNPQKSSPLVIVSTLSSNTYKGLDVLLKAAQLLKKFDRISFEWNIIGIADNDKILRHFEKKLGIHHKNVGIYCHGKRGPEELMAFLQKANVFVHPSYIDNSPNSVCEAQLLGLPVIACNTGGLSTLIRHNETGILVPSNGIHEICTYLLQLAFDQSKAQSIGSQAAHEAKLRHNSNIIRTTVMSAYAAILGS